MNKNIVIYGGGIIGGALALALKNSGLSLTLIEAQAPSLQIQGGWDNRLFAISPGSADWLAELGVWPAASNRIQPISKMQVWGDDPLASIEFDAYEVGLSALGFIAEASLIRNAIWQALKDQNNLELVCPAQGSSLRVESDAAHLALNDGRIIQTQLIIGADGADSWVRGQSQIQAHDFSYQQVGIVATFLCKEAHQGVARQWFSKTGVLAWLPMPDSQISIVWSLPILEAERLMALTEVQFATSCQEAGHNALGDMTLINRPQAFPLKLMRLSRTIDPRLALVGDAAHNLHPLAGQGINLGFRDAKALAQILISKPRQQDAGDYFLLRRYERRRREDVLATQWLTHGLQKLFNTQLPGLAYLRNRGLTFTDKQKWLKSQLMRHAIS